MKFDNQLSLIIKSMLETGNIPMLLGEPGIGKSSFVENLAYELGTKCFTLACNQLADKADLTGGRLVPTSANNDDYKQVFYPHSVVSDSIQYAIENPTESPILFLDEMNRTTPDVTSALLSIPTLRSIGNKKLPDNLKVIMAGNDKGNITALDTASVTRIVLLHVVPDTTTFLNLDPELNIYIRNVLINNPQYILGSGLEITVTKGKKDDDDDDDNDITYAEDIDSIIDDAEDMRQMTTPRTIYKLSQFLNSLDDNDIIQFSTTTGTTVDNENKPKSVLVELLEGFTGFTAFTYTLYAEIISSRSTMASQKAAMTIVKPAGFDAMKAINQRDELLNFVTNLQDTEKSDYLRYCLYQKENNKMYIEALATNLTKFEKDHATNIAELVNRDMLDNQNMADLLETDTEIAKFISFFVK